MADDLQPWIADVRRSLADGLDTLTDDEWRGPTLCEGWTVAHVVAHMTMPFRYSTGQVLRGIAKARGNFTRFSDGVASHDAALPRAELIGVLRANADNAWTPPGGGQAGALTHDVVHGLDIARPTGMAWRPADGTLVAVLDSAASARSMRHFGVSLEGVRLEATDLDWSSGEGEVRQAPALDLVLLLTGRGVQAGVA